MEEQLTEIKAKCTFLLFQNPSNHYVVARFERMDASHASLIGVGHIKQLERDAIYRLQGVYVQHPKYGMQLQIRSCERILTDDEDMLVRFLSSAHFSGIGKTTAQRIVDTLGRDVIDAIRSDAQVLDQVPGMNEKKKQAILQGLRATAVFDDAYARLSASGLNTRQIARLEDVYGDDFLEELKEDPYRPFFEIDGFSLRASEQLAACLGVEMQEERHLQAQLLNLLRQSCFQSGSTCLPKESFLSLAAQRLSPEIDAEVLLAKLCAAHAVVEWDECVYDERQYTAEVTIAQKLRQLSEERSHPGEEELLAGIRSIEQEFNITYDERQIDAITGFFAHSFLLLTGGPGTGKTTTIRGILQLYQRLYPSDEILLAAPTGRAAKRLSELSSYPASTIHSLLKWDLETNTFLVDEKDPLHCDVLIVDEFSMVDNRLFAQLLRGLPANAKLMVIGDYDQLPSVSSGQVLYDLIASERFPLHSLQRIYRQADGSGIAALASAIREQQPLSFDRDVRFIDCTPAQLRKAVWEVVASALEKGYDAKDVQVLAPKYQGGCGIDVLNRDLQALLNPPDTFKREITVGVRIFREGDKVLQLRNMREDAVCNGDIGEIIEISSEGEEGIQGPVIVVAFDDQIVEYAQETLSYLTHAYCISIHKSQGNEYPIVVLPIVREYQFMLNRRLLYTAITRAKSGLVLLGERELLESALQKNDHHVRHTGLVDQLRRFFGPSDELEIPAPPILE